MGGKRTESDDGEVLARKKSKKGMLSTGTAELTFKVCATPLL